MEILKKIFWKIVSRARLDAHGEPRRTNVIDDFLRLLFERTRGGLFQVVAPIEASHLYAKGVEPGNNFTAKRICGKSGLMTFIVSLFDENPSQFSWLEIGCADCANLITLQKNGFTNLSGVEINKKFLEAGKHFDEASCARIQTYCDSVEHFISASDRQYDVLFSCAVMQHINPQMNGVFKDLAQIAKHYIVSVEAEGQCNQFHYPRNYQRIFEQYGFEQICSALIQNDSYLGVEDGYLGYTVRILKRTS